MKLARVIRLDESDLNVFDVAAEIGEWAISGAFEFSNWTEQDVTGKARQAFANGWLGLESFGRSTFVAVSAITEAEREDLVDRLSRHFVERYGAPDVETAWPIAVEEIDQMAEMCGNQDINTLLIVERELTSAGVHERFRIIPPRDAELESFAVHGS